MASEADRFGSVILVTVLFGVPLGILAWVWLTRRRVSAGWPAPSAARVSAAEIGHVVGTAPWIWMIMIPTGGAGGLQLIPFQDLGSVLTGRDAAVQVTGNLLAFA